MGHHIIALLLEEEYKELAFSWIYSSKVERSVAPLIVYLPTPAEMIGSYVAQSQCHWLFW